jgi:hypothetical protein
VPPTHYRYPHMESDRERAEGGVRSPLPRSSAPGARPEPRAGRSHQLSRTEIIPSRPPGSNVLLGSR